MEPSPSVLFLPIISYHIIQVLMSHPWSDHRQKEITPRANAKANTRSNPWQGMIKKYYEYRERSNDEQKIWTTGLKSYHTGTWLLLMYTIVGGKSPKTLQVDGIQTTHVTKDRNSEMRELGWGSMVREREGWERIHPCLSPLFTTTTIWFTPFSSTTMARGSRPEKIGFVSCRSVHAIDQLRSTDSKPVRTDSSTKRSENSDVAINQSRFFFWKI